MGPDPGGRRRPAVSGDRSGAGKLVKYKGLGSNNRRSKQEPVFYKLRLLTPCASPRIVVLKRQSVARAHLLWLQSPRCYQKCTNTGRLAR